MKKCKFSQNLHISYRVQVRLRLGLTRFCVFIFSREFFHGVHVLPYFFTRNRFPVELDRKKFSRGYFGSVQTINLHIQNSHNMQILKKITGINRRGNLDTPEKKDCPIWCRNVPWNAKMKIGNHSWDTLYVDFCWEY